MCFSIISALIILPFSFAANSVLLSTITDKEIHGAAPYLSQMHMDDITAGNDFKLFELDVDGNRYSTSTELNAALTDAGVTKLGTETPTTLSKKLGTGLGAMTVAYKTLTAVTDADDANGDGFTSESLTGTATVDWYYMKGKVETKLEVANLSKTFCLLGVQGIVPYIKISGPVTLSTKYGVPKSQLYDIANATSPISGDPYNPVHRFYPNIGAMACFASPNLAWASDLYDPKEPSKFDASYGFLQQESAENNFPSTGANKLYFYLIVMGMDAGNAIWNVTSDDTSVTPITATVVKNTPAPGTIGFVTYNATTMVLVTLSGPDKDKIAVGAKAPVAQTSTSSVNIEITGTDGTNTVSYPFSIRNWYITRGSSSTSAAKAPAQTSWCLGLNNTYYKIAQVKDLTNASGTASTNTSETNGGTIPSVSNPSSGNYYQRRVTGGLFSEWGRMGDYTNSDWISWSHWTGEKTGASQFAVSSREGKVKSAGDENNYGVCVSQRLGGS